jgi:hypothetical protein
MRGFSVPALVVIVFCAALLVAADDKVRSFHFSKDDVGKLPSGWKADKTGKGDGSVWKVVEDKTAPSKTGYALAQTAESPGAMFNLCIADMGDDTKYKDVEVSVAFKAVAGKEDRGGGIVWRYQDNNNYYIARMNPLEDNFRVYKVENGKRTQFESADVKVPSGEWHTIKIEMTGDRITCYLDGKKYLDAKDSTFTDAGKVGLWSKADAQTYFDDFKVSGK